VYDIGRLEENTRRRSHHLYTTITNSRFIFARSELYLIDLCRRKYVTTFYFGNIGMTLQRLPVARSFPSVADHETLRSDLLLLELAAESEELQLRCLSTNSSKMWSYFPNMHTLILVPKHLFSRYQQTNTWSLKSDLYSHGPTA
jgi:hypothetical protein